MGSKINNKKVADSIIANSDFSFTNNPTNKVVDLNNPKQSFYL